MSSSHRGDTASATIYRSRLFVWIEDLVQVSEKTVVVSSEMGGRVGTPGVLLALSSPNKNEDLIV